jgi:hypothetical protein
MGAATTRQPFPKETTMPIVERLEERRLLATFTASSVAELISNMNAANAAGGSNTITLTPGTTFKLNAVNNQNNGPTGLPTVAAGNALTIVGNGDTIQRSGGASTPAFRLFAVDLGGSLSLNNLTVSGGLLTGAGGAAGGGVFSRGTLSLNRVTVQNCVVTGAPGLAAFGGGVYAQGVLAVADSTIQNNQAIGGEGYTDLFFAHMGGYADGGGLYFVGTPGATVTNSTIFSNVAKGGAGGNGLKKNGNSGGGRGGDARGGGIFAGNPITLRGTTITKNVASGGSNGGTGRGGGLYVWSEPVSLDSFTRTNTRGNTASTSDNDIFGSFSVLA